LKRILIFFN